MLFSHGGGGNGNGTGNGSQVGGNHARSRSKLKTVKKEPWYVIFLYKFFHAGLRGTDRQREKKQNQIAEIVKKQHDDEVSKYCPFKRQFTKVSSFVH